MKLFTKLSLVVLLVIGLFVWAVHEDRITEQNLVNQIPVQVVGASAPQVKPLPAMMSYAGPAVLYPKHELTPGAINPAVTQENISQTICNKGWGTASVRDTQSTPSQKNTTYSTYGITHPKNNIGANQVCELDHDISLENGGADSLDNIWPECGPVGVPLAQRYFKMKDATENYVHNGICLSVPNAKFSMGPKPSKPLTLAEGQGILRNDWYACYLKLKAGKDCN